MHGKFVFRKPPSRPYTLPPVTLKRKTIQVACGAMLVVVAAGCSGINASKSVSPLDFILPGLIRTGPPSMVPSVDATNSVRVVAQVRS